MRSRPANTSASGQMPLQMPLAPAESGSKIVIFPRSSVIISPVFDAYWRFATERQRVFFRRVRGESGPWSSDAVLQRFRFTNAYRVTDRVSQYLVNEVQGNSPQDPKSLFFRTILFKLFNRIDTWKLLQSALGELLPDSYDFARYNLVLSQAMARGERIYSAAYIMPSGNREGERKHEMHLRLLERMMREDVPLRLSDCKSMEEAFELLRSYPTIGDFLAYQYVTDLNYSTLTDFSEMEFVVPGPGSRSGIQKCFPDRGSYSEADLIRWMSDHQDKEFSDRGLTFQTLWGRPLQLIDCQNLFCEIDKYSRVRYPAVQGLSGRTRIKQEYRHNTEPIDCWLPPKWELNGRIAAWRQGESRSSQIALPAMSPA